MNPADLAPVLTLNEVATLLRLSKAHVSKLARGRVRGVKPLPVIRLGRRVLVRREALTDWFLSLDKSPAFR